ncbi:MAG: class I SAM-dependent DNA methyltransferase [Gammaproteobacteria bacterium]
MKSLADQIIAHYERHARQWDADRARTSFTERAWLDRFLSLLPAGASILDIGCGSGAPIARHFIERGFAITGIDASPTLLSLSRDRFPNHEWIVSDMRTLSLARTFQGLIAWDSFFHLAHDDQRDMFPIFRQHASDGAALLFTSGPAHGEAIGTYRDEPLYHASLAEAEYRSLLATNGFDVVAHVAKDPGCGAHTIWLAQLTQSRR